jgi:outer membrane protein OmpA-like peptidoglycan-associated protein
MKKSLLISLIFVLPFLVSAQTNVVQNGAIPKDAPVDVTVTDFKDNVRTNEIIVFRSQMNQREYEGLTNDSGKFSLRLPAGDKYEIFILGFKDSTSYNILDIPATTGNAYYKNPFKINIQFLPAKTFVLDDCNFETGKSILEPESFAVLDELVAYLNRKDDQRIELGGYTDNVGSAASNLKLSQERANMVKAYILSKGISPDRVTAVGYGMSNPVEENTTAEGRAKNRRTEVKILE